MRDLSWRKDKAGLTRCRKNRDRTKPIPRRRRQATRTARTAKTTKTAKTSLAENERQQGQGQKEGLEEGLEEDRQQGQPETDKRRKTAEGRGGDDQKIRK